MSILLNDAQKLLRSQSENQEITNAEVYIEKKTESRIRLERGEVNVGIQKHIWGGAIRVLVKKGIGFSTFTNMENGKQAFESAIANAKIAPQNPYATIPDVKETKPLDGGFDKRIANLVPEDLNEKIMEIKNTLQEKKTHGNSASIRTVIHEIAISNLNGIALSGNSTKMTLGAEITLKKEDNISAGYAETISKTIDFEKSPEELVLESYDLAEKQLIVSKVSTEKLPIILHPIAVREIFGWPFPPEILGSNVVKGASPFIGKIGERIAPDIISIVDEGLNKESFYSFKFDDEGVPRQNNTVVDKGILKMFLYDSKSAMEAKTESTGNCGRFGLYDGRSYQFMPSCATHNLKFQPGDMKKEEMFDIKRGIYMVYPIGAHSANPANGKFNVLPYIAFLVENGEIVGGLKKFILSSTIQEVLNKIDSVGDKIENTAIEWNHQLSSPYIRLSDVNVIE